MGELYWIWPGTFPLKVIAAVLINEKIPDDVVAANVSGYYGPGSFVAWHITAASAVYSYEWHIYCQYLGLRERKMDQSPKVALDITLLGTIVYPAVAIVDLAIKVANRDFGPSADAAACVAVTSWWLSAACTTAEFVQWRSTGQLNLRSRPFAWAGLLLSGGIVLLVTQYASPNGSLSLGLIVNHWAIPLCELYFWIMLSGLLKSADIRRSEHLTQKFVMSIIPAFGAFLTLCLGLKRSPDSHGNIVSIPFPITSSRLNDLDQIAAVGTAVVAVSITTFLDHIKHHKNTKAVEDSQEMWPILGNGITFGDEEADIPKSTHSGLTQSNYGGI